MNRSRRPDDVAIRSPLDMFPQQLFSVENAHGACELSDLDAAELALVADAVPKRRREFAAGRRCAHRALARLPGFRGGPLLRGPHGSPLWPPGVVGSISHTKDFAIAAVAKRDRVVSVGVDAEHRTEPFPARSIPHICVDRELADLDAVDRRQRDVYAYAYFSIKETIYKCVYGATGDRLGFHDAEVEFDFGRGVFAARLKRSVAGYGDRIVGRVGYDETKVYSSAWYLRERSSAASFA